MFGQGRLVFGINVRTRLQQVGNWVNVYARAKRGRMYRTRNNLHMVASIIGIQAFRDGPQINGSRHPRRVLYPKGLDHYTKHMVRRFPKHESLHKNAENAARRVLHDPQIYPNPEVFSPERSLEKDSKPAQRNPRACNFGFGRR